MSIIKVWGNQNDFHNFMLRNQILKKSAVEIRLLILQQIFLLIIMMYRIRGIKDLISFKNEQCTCFGSALQVEEKFLAKQKTYNFGNSPTNNPANLITKEQSFFKKGFKKSLKKHFTPLLHHRKSDSNIDLNANPCEIKALNSIGKEKEFKDLLRPQSKVNNFNHKTNTIPDEHLSSLYSPKTSQFPQPIIAEQLNQTSYNSLPPFLPTSPRPIILIPILQSPKSIKINYNSPPAQPTNSNANEQKKSASPTSIKTLERSVSDKKIGINEADEKEDLRRCVSSKNFQLTCPPEFTRKMSENEKQSVLSSNQKEEKAKLKKMDDVAQIYSQIDSQEEFSDSDVESVVLGRLNEYSSTIDHDISDISTIERSTQGKVIRINSLMTNFDFDRNQAHGTTSQFLSY